MGGNENRDDVTDIPKEPTLQDGWFVTPKYEEPIQEVEDQEIY